MIGIIANPASGKDIRRLVSYATVVDNNEKVNIVKRIVLAAQGCGVSSIFIMPDTYQIGYKVIEDLTLEKRLSAKVDILDMEMKGSHHDTTYAAKLMKEMNIKCVLVLGGDGTSRAVAKTIQEIPIIAISTGTNNVYPIMMEGTIAGMAAAAVCFGYGEKNIKRDKRIEIYKDKELLDIALVDAVISKNLFVGAKAIWNVEDILKIITTRSHPASIGFSALVGCKQIVSEDEDYGLYVDLNDKYSQLIAPLGAGIIEKIHMSEPKILRLNEEYVYLADTNRVIALDGEREIEFKQGEKLTFKITRKGPVRVKVSEVLENAQKSGFFIR